MPIFGYILLHKQPFTIKYSLFLSISPLITNSSINFFVKKKHELKRLKQFF